MTIEDKYIGLILAICSSFLIGLSFVVTKKGLINSSTEEYGNATDTHRYLKNPIWWTGLITMVLGEVMNFIGYTFAPAILITPLGALSVIIGAILGTLFLNEKLGSIAIIGCFLSVIGAVIIIFNAPKDPEVQSVQELVNYMVRPGFLVYSIFTILIVIGMIWKVVPRWGRKTPIVYLSICSLIGSLSVMAIKAFGIAIKLTAAGYNQFNQVSTYVFGFMCIVFILVQVNYFNKALDSFSSNVVNPIYYVCFTTATMIASAIMFQGWHTSSSSNTVSLICGFLVIFSGVYLLNKTAAPNTAPSIFSSRRSLPQSGVYDITIDNEKSEYPQDHPDSSSPSRPRASSV